VKYGYNRLWLEGDLESVVHRSRGVNFRLRLTQAAGDELLPCGSTSRMVADQLREIDAFAVTRVLVGSSILMRPTRLVVNDLAILWTIAAPAASAVLSGTYVVGEYKRTLASGRVVLVKPHRRGKPHRTANSARRGIGSEGRRPHQRTCRSASGGPSSIKLQE
jgi:hypothetical protein